MTGALATALSAGATPARAQPQAAQKPTIVFVLVDNLGYGEVDVYGGS